MKRMVLLLLVAACHRATTDTASGTVEATEAQLGFQLPGRIDAIRVREGDAVHQGDTLAVLDRAELAARRAQAAAQLAELEHGARTEELAIADANLRAVSDQLANAQRDLDRSRQLVDQRVIPQQQYDHARTQVDLLTSQKAQAEQQLALLRAGTRPERIAGARAAVAQLDASLANGVIRAPFDGIVTVKNRESGETVAAGMPVVTVMNLGDRWVRIYIPEARIGTIHVGDSTAISTDNGKHYGGVVSFIASQAEFTPRNVQTREERVKLVYAVKVRITHDPSNDLKPGIPADVSFGH